MSFKIFFLATVIIGVLILGSIGFSQDVFAQSNSEIIVTSSAVRESGDKIYFDWRLGTADGGGYTGNGIYSMKIEYCCIDGEPKTFYDKVDAYGAGVSVWVYGPSSNYYQGPYSAKIVEAYAAYDSPYHYVGDGDELFYPAQTTLEPEPTSEPEPCDLVDFDISTLDLTGNFLLGSLLPFAFGADPCPPKTFTSVKSGDWSSSTTWKDSEGNNGVPRTQDDKIIKHTVTMFSSVSNSGLIQVDHTLINSNNLLHIGTLNISGLLTNKDTITNLASGIINNNSGGTIGNFGTLNNNYDATLANSGAISNIDAGTIFNSGTINNDSDGTLINNNSGTINNNSKGTLTNKGTIDNNIGIIKNSGTINNNSGGTINNKGTVDNNYDGTITNNSVFYNESDISNTGTIFVNKGGELTNTSDGIITNNDSILNTGTITNNSGGTIINNPDGVIYNDNYGIITNNSDSTITNKGSITNEDGTITNNSGGTITNIGSFSNHQSFHNYGMITNLSGGTINNTFIFTNNPGATITNVDTINNSSQFDNFGTLTNNFGGTINNNKSGTITNNSGGTITNNTGGTITNNSGGFINNNSHGIIINNHMLTNIGTITNNSGGTINNNSGGTIHNLNTITNNSGGIITNMGNIEDCGDYTGTLPSGNKIIQCTTSDSAISELSPIEEPTTSTTSEEPKVTTHTDSDGIVITTETYLDGTVKTIYPDRRVTTYTDSDGIVETSTWYLDGTGRFTTTLTHPDGSSYTTHPDGTVTGTMISDDGTITTTHLDGTITTTYPDGTTIVEQEGTLLSRTIVDSDGTLFTTHNDQDTRTRTYPDGSFDILHPDGGITKSSDGTSTKDSNGDIITTYPNGAKTITDPDGHMLIIHPNGQETLTYPIGISHEIYYEILGNSKNNNSLLGTAGVGSAVDSTSSSGIIGGSVGSAGVTNIPDVQIPDHFKTSVLWWADGKTSDGEFANAVEFLIKEEIIRSPNIIISDFANQNPGLEHTAGVEPGGTFVVIPEWIKNNGKWFAEGKISSNDFVSGIEFMIANKIITSPNIQILGTSDGSTVVDSAPDRVLTMDEEATNKVIQHESNILVANNLALEQLLEMQNFLASSLDDASEMAWQYYSENKNTDNMNNAVDLEKKSKIIKNESIQTVQTLKDSQEITGTFFDAAHKNGFDTFVLKNNAEEELSLEDAPSKIRTIDGLKNAVTTLESLDNFIADNMDAVEVLSGIDVGDLPETGNSQSSRYAVAFGTSSVSDVPSVAYGIDSQPTSADIFYSDPGPGPVKNEHCDEYGTKCMPTWFGIFHAWWPEGHPNNRHE